MTLLSFYPLINLNNFAKILIVNFEVLAHNQYHTNPRSTTSPTSLVHLHLSQTLTRILMAEKNPNATAVAAADRAEDAKYKECLRNFSRENGGFVFDGCGLFTRLGDGPNQVLVCEACGCHRNHHRNNEIPPSNVQVIAIEMRLLQIRRALAAPPRVVIDNGEDAPQASTDDE